MEPAKALAAEKTQCLTARPAVFCLAVGLLVAVTGGLLTAFGAPLVYAVDCFTAQMFAAVARLVGGQASVDRITIFLQFGQSGRTFMIGYGCDGVLAYLILASAILPFPCSWKARFTGLGAGLLFVFLMNQVRLWLLVGLLFVARDPAAFAFGHTWGGQIFGIVMIFLFWIYWATRVLPRPPAVADTTSAASADTDRAGDPRP